MISMRFQSHSAALIAAVLVILTAETARPQVADDEAVSPAAVPDETEADTSPRKPAGRQLPGRGPEAGQPLPNVTIFDAEGKPFSLSQLRGHYSVLVFGCLT